LTFMSGSDADLPVMAVLPSLLAALTIRSNAVLIAPPGAGKTTRVAPAMLAEPWASGAIWLLSPRRLAARAAAERIAAEMGVPLGGLVGYATRLDSKASAQTRILVMTHGLFRNRLLADPELHGVSAVIFDEVHERSLDSDFALALAIDAQQGLRPDLRLLAMSATLDGNRFAGLLGGATVLECEGKAHPLTIRYMGRRAEQPLAEAVIGAAKSMVLNGVPGDILAFLPGAGDIERAATLADAAALPLIVHKLHGQIDPEMQRRAIAPDAEGRRKLILATSIAETSLTIAGVRVVIDSGMARRPRFDRSAGMTRLVTERASQAAATQRAGRAARQGPGIAVRLWEEAATGGMPPFDPPEIHESDLMPVVLDCASWGIVDPRQLAWLDQPTPAALLAARAQLQAIGALGDDGRITAHGATLASVPLPVPLAHMLVAAAEAGQGARAAQLAVLLTEPGLGGRDADIDTRWRRWQNGRGERADGAWRLARRLAKIAEKHALKSAGRTSDMTSGALLALAYPDRVARARADKRGEYLSVGGRAFQLDPADSLCNALWLVIADAQGRAQGARILAAAALDEADIELVLGAMIEQRPVSRYLPQEDRVEQQVERRVGAISLSAARIGRDKDAIDQDVAVRMAYVAAHGLGALGWGEGALSLIQRAAYCGLNDLADTNLLSSTHIWLAPALKQCRGLRDISDDVLVSNLTALLDWQARQMLDQMAPTHFQSPAGGRHPIDYGAEGGPRVTLRVQEVFGLAVHPVIGRDRAPLVLALTSPAHRPIQTTRDLPGFWAGSWRDVQREMKGRYPKHVWPDDPAHAQASTMTKAALARRSPSDTNKS
jgi:ATP-dependent helicase HrpB